MSDFFHTFAIKFAAFLGGIVLAITGASHVASQPHAQTASVAEATQQTDTTPNPNPDPAAPTVSVVPTSQQSQTSPRLPSPNIINNYFTLPGPVNPTGTVTQAQLAAAMQGILTTFNTELYGSTSTFAGGGLWGALGATQRIDNLSNVTITNPTITGLSAGSIPDLSGSYLSLGGGTVAGDLTVTGAFSAGTFSFATASSTNLLTQNATTTYLTATNATFTNATTTNLYIQALQANVSSSTVLATGGTVSRSLAAIEGDTINILSRQAQTSPTTDFTSALNTALAGSVPVFLPQTGTPYQINNTITFGASSTLICQPGVQINSVGTHQIFSVPNPNVTITDCTFVKPSGSSGILGIISGDHFTWTGGGSNGAAGLFLNSSGANYADIENTRQINSTATAISIQNNAHNNTIRSNEFQNEVGFGVWVTLGANANIIDGNWTDGNGIELIGITYTGYDNTITNNRAQGTGDNCFSVSGYNNRVVGNTGYHCAFTGLALYGNSNTATGNTLIGNGQAHNPSSPFYNAANANLYGGITIGGGFGGAGQNNVVTGNFSDDDQTVPTQAYDLKITSGYGSWTTGTAYTSGTQVYSSGNIYQASNSATSGASAPTCSTGTCSDGAVTWTFLAATPMGTREPAGNVVSGNRVWRFGTAAFIDSTINHTNSIMLENTISLSGSLPTGSGVNTIAGGFQKKIGTNWSQGMTVHYGDLVYTNVGNNLYRVVNAGGTTGSTQPSNTSGTQTTSDSISWLWLATGAFYPQFNINSSDVTLGVRLSLPVMESASATCTEYAGTGSPEGKVTSSICGMYLRSDGATSSTLYIKESGTGNTGWVATGAGYWSLTNGNLFNNSGTNIALGTSTASARLTVWGPDSASSTLAFNVVSSSSSTVFAVFDGGNAQLSGTLTQSSDQRLKTNIQSLDPEASLAAINALNPVTFNWIDPNKDSTQQLGFIAQQVLPIFPDLVSTTSPTTLTPDGTLSLNYIDLVAPIVKAIQALSNKIASIETTIAGFANVFHTNELCVGSTCVTPAQFQAMVAAAGQSGTTDSNESSSSDSDETITPPVIQVNGLNPATIQVGATYSDLSATITGPQSDLNLDINTFVNGVAMNPVQIDTTAAATDTIEYVVTDQNGLTATSTRTVIVQAPQSSDNSSDQAASSTSQ